MVTSTPSQSSATDSQQLAKESLTGKPLQLLVNTQCLSATEGDGEQSAYTKQELPKVANLAQNVASALPGNIKNGVNVPIGDPDSLEQVRLPEFFFWKDSSASSFTTDSE